jgi:pyruvate carboxylase
MNYELVNEPITLPRSPCDVTFLCFIVAVSMRFLDECPWKRLREIRAACPNVCLQMLVRGSNAVGYTSYPDNVVAEFIRLAALNGMDVFRIFDCFNDISSMEVSIQAVRAANKVAEVCVCYTGNMLTSEIYHAAYYRSVAEAAVKAGAHMIAIKDMAGLLRPNEVLLDLVCCLRATRGFILISRYKNYV